MYAVLLRLLVALVWCCAAGLIIVLYRVVHLLLMIGLNVCKH